MLLGNFGNEQLSGHRAVEHGLQPRLAHIRLLKKYIEINEIKIAK